MHDIDIKDAKFARPEAEGIRVLLAGLGASTDNDEGRLARGAAIFEDPYRSFERNEAEGAADRI